MAGDEFTITISLRRRWLLRPLVTLSALTGWGIFSALFARCCGRVNQ